MSSKCFATKGNPPFASSRVRCSVMCEIGLSKLLFTWSCAQGDNRVFGLLLLRKAPVRVRERHYQKGKDTAHKVHLCGLVPGQANGQFLIKGAIERLYRGQLRRSLLTASATLFRIDVQMRRRHGRDRVQRSILRSPVDARVGPGHPRSAQRPACRRIPDCVFGSSARQSCQLGQAAS